MTPMRTPLHRRLSAAAALRARRLLATVRTRAVERAVITGTDDLREQMAELSQSLREIRVQAIGSRLSNVEDQILRVRQQLRYLSLRNMTSPILSDPRDLTPFEMSFLSQNGEDGVLVEILRRIDVSTGSFVEIGASHAEANCLFLADVLGWPGWFVDADAVEVSLLKRKYAGNRSVRIVEAFVDRDNINDVLGQAGATGEIDVFSLDIDGNDYWVWQALEVISPRVVVVEYNSAFDQNVPTTQIYEPAATWDGTDAFGSSREALRELGNRKHYRLVHADIAGVNLM